MLISSHINFTSILIFLVVIAAFVIGFWGCSGDKSNNTSSDPVASGTIRVITQTTGSGSDDDGYLVTVLQSTKSIAMNDTVLFESVSPGTYTVSLDDIAAGCDASDNPRTGVTVTDGNTTTVTFDISCVDAGSFGSMEVTIITSGNDPDTRYYVVVDDVDSTIVNPGGVLPDTTTVTIIDTVGTHQVELVDVADNCGVSTTNPQSVLVEENISTAVIFGVGCAGDLLPNEIVFVRYDDQGISQIWVCDAQANNQTQLTFGGNNKALPRWSPDGTRILYNGEVVDSFGVVVSGEIVIMEPDGSLPDTISFPPDFQPGPADWSPDGTKLVIKGNLLSNPTEPNYFIYDFTNVSAPLVSYTNQPGWFDIRFSMPFWSPDGLIIVFSGENANLSNYHTTSIFTVPATGGDATLIATDTLWGFSYPQWSDDGLKLAFNGPSSHIWVCGSDGNDLHAVHEQGSYNGQPTWLPDGRIGFQPDNGVGLFIVNDDGTGLTSIGVGPDALFLQPDWNPNP